MSGHNTDVMIGMSCSSMAHPTAIPQAAGSNLNALTYSDSKVLRYDLEPFDV